VIEIFDFESDKWHTWNTAPPFSFACLSNDRNMDKMEELPK